MEKNGRTYYLYMPASTMKVKRSGQKLIECETL